MIYVLECENGKYYVGKTAHLQKRFTDHLSGTGAVWTQIHRPIRILESHDATSEFHEVHITLVTMKEYGVDNVRGATWCSIELSPEELSQIDRHLISASGRCYLCQETGHMRRSCPLKHGQSIKPKPKAPTGCMRCGRDGHITSSCYAKTLLPGFPRVESSSSEEEPVRVARAPKSRATTTGCARCGRPGHSASACSASSTVQGELLDDLSSDEEADLEPDPAVCFRCGYAGHFVRDCYAKRHFSGAPLYR